MEVFNFAYGEITGVSHTKTSDEAIQNKYQSIKSSPARNIEARNYDRKLVQKISSILDQVEGSTRDQKVAKWRRTAWIEDEDENEEAGWDPDDMGTSDKDTSGPECVSPRRALTLTKEETETFKSEGIPLPSVWPFSKTEERVLKRVRRKIKNKLSAQESRRKKKEYIGTLEKRVEVSDKENILLKHKVDSLENTVKALLTELKRLSKNTLERERQKKTVTMCSRAVQTGTCLKCLTKKSKGHTERPLHPPRSEHLARSPEKNSNWSDATNNSSGANHPAAYSANSFSNGGELNSSGANHPAAYSANSFSNGGEDKDDAYLSDVIPPLPDI